MSIAFNKRIFAVIATNAINNATEVTAIAREPNNARPTVFKNSSVPNALKNLIIFATAVSIHSPVPIKKLIRANENNAKYKVVKPTNISPAVRINGTISIINGKQAIPN